MATAHRVRVAHLLHHEEDVVVKIEIHSPVVIAVAVELVVVVAGIE